MEELSITAPGAVDGTAGTYLDLAEAYGAVRLIHAALESAAGMEMPPGMVPIATDEGPLNPRSLLTVMIYATARGIFDMDELEVRLQSDPDLRYLCAHRFPDSHALRKFRRRHWRLLEVALAGLIRRSAADGGGSGFQRPGEAEAEAQRRLRLSVWTDTVA